MKFVVFFMLIVCLSRVSSAPYDSAYAIDEDLRAEVDAVVEGGPTTEAIEVVEDPSSNTIPKEGRNKLATDAIPKPPVIDGESNEGEGPALDAAAETDAEVGAAVVAEAGIGSGPETGPGAGPGTGPGAGPGTGPGARPGTGPGARPEIEPEVEEDVVVTTEDQEELGNLPPAGVRVQGAAVGELHSEPETTLGDVTVQENSGPQNARRAGLRRIQQLANNLKHPWSNRLTRFRAQGPRGQQGAEVVVGAGDAGQIDAGVGIDLNNQGEQSNVQDRPSQPGERNTLRVAGGISAGGSLPDIRETGTGCTEGTNCGDGADVVGAMPTSPAIKNLLGCPSCVILPQGSKTFNPFSFQGFLNHVGRKKQWVDANLGGRWLRENILTPLFPWGRPLFTKFLPQEVEWN